MDGVDTEPAALVKEIDEVRSRGHKTIKSISLSSYELMLICVFDPGRLKGSGSHSSGIQGFRV